MEFYSPSTRKFGSSRRGTPSRCSPEQELTPLSSQAKRNRELDRVAGLDAATTTPASLIGSPLKRRVLDDSFGSPIVSRGDLLNEQNMGFPISHATAEYFSSESYQNAKIQRQHRWEEFFMNNPEMIDRDVAAAKLNEEGTKLWRHVRDLCRLGIPPNKRRTWWQILSGSISKRKTSLGNYARLLAQGQETRASWNDIDKDVKRTFPDHPRFRTEGGQEELRRVLTAYAARNPDVGYCQSMNFIAGALLLYMNEEESFWTLVSIIEDRMPEGFYNRKMDGLRIDIAVFGRLVEQELPRLHAHLESHDIAAQTFMAQCFACIFVNVLPIECALRVWDAFLFEGSKVLFRVGLALLRHQEKALLNFSEPTAIHQFLFSYPKQFVDSSELMRMAWEDQPPPMFAPFSPMAHLKTKLRRGRRISISIQEFRESTNRELSPSVSEGPAPPAAAASASPHVPSQSTAGAAAGGMSAILGSSVRPSIRSLLHEGGVVGANNINISASAIQNRGKELASMVTNRLRRANTVGGMPPAFGATSAPSPKVESSSLPPLPHTPTITSTPSRPPAPHVAIGSASAPRIAAPSFLSTPTASGPLRTPVVPASCPATRAPPPFATPTSAAAVPPSSINVPMSATVSRIPTLLAEEDSFVFATPSVSAQLPRMAMSAPPASSTRGAEVAVGNLIDWDDDGDANSGVVLDFCSALKTPAPPSAIKDSKNNHGLNDSVLELFSTKSYNNNNNNNNLPSAAAAEEEEKTGVDEAFCFSDDEDGDDDGNILEKTIDSSISNSDEKMADSSLNASQEEEEKEEKSEAFDRFVTKSRRMSTFELHETTVLEGDEDEDEDDSNNEGNDNDKRGVGNLLDLEEEVYKPETSRTPLSQHRSPANSAYHHHHHHSSNNNNNRHQNLFDNSILFGVEEENDEQEQEDKKKQSNNNILDDIIDDNDAENQPPKNTFVSSSPAVVKKPIIPSLSAPNSGFKSSSSSAPLFEDDDSNWLLSPKLSAVIHGTSIAAANTSKLGGNTTNNNTNNNNGDSTHGILDFIDSRYKARASIGDYLA